jgi:Protein of unknown function (DUF3592)
MNNQIFGFISIAVGIGIAAYFVWAMKRQLATGKWIAASGKVLESRILDHGSSLEPYVKYSYVVRGQTYISERMAPNNYVYDQPASMSSINRMIAPYAVGKTIKVYFDPNNPQDAVLKKRDSIFGDIILVVVSLIFIFVGLGLVTGK